MSLRRWLAGITAIALVGVAAPAHAATTVTIPAHTSDSNENVRLYGATPAGFLVEQGSWPSERLLAGAAGSTLTGLGSPSTETLGASGSYGWYREAGGGRAHRIDLRTRAETSYPMTDQWLAWTPDGWIFFRESDLSIVRQVAGGAATTLVTGAWGGSSFPTAVADATGAVLMYDQVQNGVKDRFVSQVTWGRAGLETVWKQSQGKDYALLLRTIAISPGTIAFTTQTGFAGNAMFVHTRPRAGGAITTTALPADVDAWELAVAGSAVGFRTARGADNAGPIEVAVLNGGSWRYVALPGTWAAYLQSTGTTFAIGVSGKNTEAGVWTIGVTGGATRAATLTPPPATQYDLALSAGRLTYADNAVSSAFEGGTLWRHAVSGSTSVTLGAESRLTPPVTVGSGFAQGSPLAFSAARGIVRKPSAAHEFQLMDRGVITRTLPTPADPNLREQQISGPYAAFGNKVYRADGTLALDLSADPNGQQALFGRTLVAQYQGKILLRDLEKPAAAPTTLSTSGVCADLTNPCQNGLAAWHDTVAWAQPDGKIRIRTLSTRATRVVDLAGGTAWGLRMSDGVLSWKAGGAETHLLDLTSATSTPVTVDDLSLVRTDGHLLAGLSSETGQVVVRTLPFGSTRRSPVRLVGTLAPASFTPGTWAPQFDLTKPATGVTLTLSSGTTTVRTLTGTAPDGSIRDLVWNGTNTAGTRLPAGSYTYRLTATAADGEGALTPVTGTVKIT